MSKVGKDLVEALKEVLAIVRGEAEPACTYHINVDKTKTSVPAPKSKIARTYVNPKQNQPPQK